MAIRGAITLAIPTMPPIPAKIGFSPPWLSGRPREDEALSPSTAKNQFGFHPRQLSDNRNHAGRAGVETGFQLENFTPQFLPGAELPRDAPSFPGMVSSAVGEGHAANGTQPCCQNLFKY